MSRTPKAAAAKKPRAPAKGHKLAEQFPLGEILQDVTKKQWRLGPVIGQGGFGLIYLASDDLNSNVPNSAPYVVKIEPKANGPLFCEMAFYQRACKPEMIDTWLSSHKLRYLGLPKYIAAGSCVYKGKEYRFMVLERFSTDLQKLFDKTKQFPPATVLCLGLRILDALEYLHSHEYVHADIKAANILQGYKNGKVQENEVYLVDFGLAFRYVVDGKHKEYKEDPKRLHDGTIEFTSRDAHKGLAPSRRGDLEILGYCLLQWLCGKLPWENKLADKNYVRDSKIRYMSNIPSLMKACSAVGDAPDAVSNFLSNIIKLDYDEKPCYSSLKRCLQQGLKKLGTKDEWKLNFSGVVTTTITKPAAKPRKRKGADSDLDESFESPRKKTAKSLTNGHQKAAARVTSPKSRASPAAKSRTTAAKSVSSPMARAGKSVTSPRGRTTTPKTLTSPRARAGKSVTSPRGRTTTPKTLTSPKKTKGSTPRSKPSPKKTVKRKRKKVEAADASIQTTPSLSRKR